MNESAIYIQLGQLVQQHRERLQMSQQDLGAAISLSRASIANIETGRQRIPLHNLYRLARALKVEPETLLPNLGTDLQPPPEARKIKSTLDLNELEQADVERVVNITSFREEG